MSSAAPPGNAGRDPREFASRKVLTVLGVPAAGGETLGFWIDSYLTAAVDGLAGSAVGQFDGRSLRSGDEGMTQTTD